MKLRGLSVFHVALVLPPRSLSTPKVDLVGTRRQLIGVGGQLRILGCGHSVFERELFIDNLLVRIHLITDMI